MDDVDFDMLFDPDGDGLYQNITRVRVRSTEATDAQQSQDSFGGNAGLGQSLFLQARVLQDLNVNTDNQELFAFTSHTLTTNEGWDGSDNFDPFECRPYNNSWNIQDPDGSGGRADSGWCSNQFIDLGTDSFDNSDQAIYDVATIGFQGGNNVLNVSGTLVKIVGARPAVSKVNLDGSLDIADNGDEVTFQITPRVVGSDAEALTEFVATDVLPDHYQYVSHTSPADFPGICAYDAASTTVTCTYTGNAPGNGFPGGWPDSRDASFTITVVVTGGIAQQDSSTFLSNTANVETAGIGPWTASGDSTGDFSGTISAAVQTASNSAGSFMPLPADESDIVKAVDALDGACEVLPDPNPDGLSLEEWGARCSMIDLDENMSFELSVTNEGNTALTVWSLWMCCHLSVTVLTLKLVRILKFN